VCEEKSIALTLWECISQMIKRETEMWRQ